MKNEVVAVVRVLRAGGHVGGVGRDHGELGRVEQRRLVDRGHARASQAVLDRDRDRGLADELVAARERAVVRVQVELQVAVGGSAETERSDRLARDDVGARGLDVRGRHDDEARRRVVLAGRGDRRAGRVEDRAEGEHDVDLRVRVADDDLDAVAGRIAVEEGEDRRGQRQRHAGDHEDDGRPAIGARLRAVRELAPRDRDDVRDRATAIAAAGRGGGVGAESTGHEAAPAGVPAVGGLRGAIGRARGQMVLLRRPAADALDEDLLDRRVGDLEMRDAKAAVERRPEDGLGIDVAVDVELRVVERRAARCGRRAARRSRRGRAAERRCRARCRPRHSREFDAEPHDPPPGRALDLARSGRPARACRDR